MINRIRIQNFRSIVDATVELDSLTVLIGKSGTGKTNFVHAVRFLRDTLNSRVMNFDALGGRDKVLHVDHRKRPIAFEVELSIPGVDKVMRYSLSQEHNGQIDEAFSLGDEVVFHHRGPTWVKAPKIIPQPAPNGILLGAIPGLQESTIAYVALRSGTGCYDFSGSVLQGGGRANDASDRGLGDSGDNYLNIAERINTDITKLTSWKRIAKAMTAINRAAEGLTLDMPGAQRVDIALRAGQNALTFDIRQESEGFRRFLAHLFALYQTPSKQTMLFEQPETGLHPGALEALFEEFEACPNDGRGQVILTTHSPQLLDYFDAESIRVVEMRGHQTTISRLDNEQTQVIKEELLRPGELLTVEPARSVVEVTE